MIDKALEYLRGQLNEYLGQQAPALVELGNIALHETGGETTSSSINDNIVISVVSIVEEATLKNNRHFKIGSDQTVDYQNPAININLFLLLSANRKDYKVALSNISEVIAFFQQKNVFTPENSPGLPANIEKLILDMHSISFEQLNNLWGYLGGKYIPSVLYLMRLLSIQEDLRTKAPLIENLGEIPKVV